MAVLVNKIVGWRWSRIEMFQRKLTKFMATEVVKQHRAGWVGDGACWGQKGRILVKSCEIPFGRRKCFLVCFRESLII